MYQSVAISCSKFMHDVVCYCIVSTYVDYGNDHKQTVDIFTFIAYSRFTFRAFPET